MLAAVIRMFILWIEDETKKIDEKSKPKFYPKF